MDNIVLSYEDDMIFIDLSYFVFYRYYATFNWLKKFLQLDITSETIMENQQFIEKYSKLFEKTLCDLIKTHSITWSNMFLVKDCPRESIWRNAFFTNYKGTREERLDTFNREIFKFTYAELLPALELKYGFKRVSHPNLEADDIIAILKKQIRAMRNDNKVVIITNDNDYIQLIDDHTLILNLQGNEIGRRVNMSPIMYLKCKIIMGDKSDNIPCIMKKVGPKTSEKLAQNDETFLQFCKKYPEAREQFELNKLLIDFSCIPEEHVNSLTGRVVKN